LLSFFHHEDTKSTKKKEKIKNMGKQDRLRRHENAQISYPTGEADNAFLVIFLLSLCSLCLCGYLTF